MTKVVGISLSADIRQRLRVDGVAHQSFDGPFESMYLDALRAAEGRNIIVVDIERSGASYAFPKVLREAYYTGPIVGLCDLSPYMDSCADEFECEFLSLGGTKLVRAGSFKRPIELLIATINAINRNDSRPFRGPQAEAGKIGASDYAGKVVLRHNEHVVLVDSIRRRVSLGGEPVRFSDTQFKLFAAMAAEPGRIFSREQLMNVVDLDLDVDERAVDAQIKRMRTSLGPAYSIIQTVHRAGYKLVES